MVEIFYKTIPFFAILGLGFGAARARFFDADATRYLTKFVFYFALSAMLFRFSSNLSLAEIWDGHLVAAYLCGTLAVYLFAMIIALIRRQSIAIAAFEAQCAAIGNTGFLGIPMLTLLLGSAAIGPMVLALAVDLIVFSSLITIIVTIQKQGSIKIWTVISVAKGLVQNPMIVAMGCGFFWSGTGIGVGRVFDDFLLLLGAAATPGALFSIGASLAVKHAERPRITLWLSLAKLGLHPACVAFFALWIFNVSPFDSAVIICAAALPVAGNIYILAQHYGIAVQRVSAAIFISTATSIVTVSLIVGWVSTNLLAHAR